MNNFDEFWSLYPRKVDKKAARKRWKQMGADNGLFPEIIEGLRRQLPYMMTVEWKYRKHPAVWLNGECWTNEVEPVKLTVRELIEANEEKDRLFELQRKKK